MKRSGARFGVTPSGGEGPGEGGYAEWHQAMRLVARLPAGVPHHFRRKDLHRTGCSLFCGAEGRENQGMLRRVLLAYARWNKDVGYCQGFNMLAAIILEVMDKSEADSLKVMIYLVEAVLPEGYFADDLRGLSADMAAFRDLLKRRRRASTARRVHDAMVPHAVRDLAAARLLAEDMGPGASRWQRSATAHRTRYLGFTSRVQSMTKRGLRLFYSEDEGDSSDDGNKMALTTVIPRKEDLTGTGDRLSLDIGALKRQYARLRERQRQAHVILAAACARHAAVGVPTSPTSLTVNNLLLGKSAIVSSRGRRLGPPPGAVPPSRQSRSHEKTSSRTRVRSSETISWQEEKSRKSLSRRNSVKWKDIKSDKSLGNLRKASFDLDEPGDGTIVSEIEANQMLASLRSRSSSETSSYSSHSDSSTDTSLCDENEKGSDSDVDLLEDDTKSKNIKIKSDKPPISPILKDKQASYSPVLRDYKKLHTATSEQIETKLSVVKDITDYLDSAAGEPLRTYIDEFDTKLNSSVTDEANSYNLRTALASPLSQGKKTMYRNKFTGSPQDMLLSPSAPALVLDSQSIEISPLLPKSPTPKSSIFHGSSRLTRSTPSPIDIENISRIPRLAPTETRNEARSSPSTERSHIARMPQETLSSSYTPTPRSTSEVMRRLNICNKTDNEIVKHETIQKSSVYLSPVDITPSSCDFLTNFKSPTHIKHFTSSRPPDIIDSLTMYANFVPDIDLSDNTSPDPGSTPRSPGNESITVSEDEPPIQLKIDKYFEHSPEFFGARVTDPNNTDIPNRRSTKRLSRLSKKPESLTLQSNNSDKILKAEVERASSLPQSHSFTKKLMSDDEFENNDVFKATKPNTPEYKKESEPISPKDYILRSGRKNSERALQIIQENSKILSRILTKQNTADVTIASSDYVGAKNIEYERSRVCPTISEKSSESKLVESPLLKESTSDSLIGCRKRNVSDGAAENRKFVRIRPISIDDPFSLESRNIFHRNEEFLRTAKSPSTECLANKADTYGWVNKAFLAKCDRPLLLDKKELQFDFDFKKQSIVPSNEDCISELKPAESSEWARNSFSAESRTSVTMPSTEPKDTPTYGRRFTSGDCHYPLSNKYSDYVLSAASDICRKTINEGSKLCENIQKTDESQASEFSQNVTSSISFTYEPSLDDDSLAGAKSNSSDTLCQIASLDQVSTPISPKMFPVKDTPTFPKDYVERSDKIRFDSDDTCSAITSLLETDTLSSLSYPRSPSTGSYHPFPTRPVMRMPKEIGVKLGLYPKDAINSAPK
ncbi:TBC1 domain family member 30 [Operophtera brumata]|uniref:TBC1 domain family member 30 n=1 Tax=Operophtera brumata TaxID=104452 RepID=A0A0L7LKL2_OPEBR|nr:TBC1 domain family member 30 [Operophtera brumata]